MTRARISHVECIVESITGEYEATRNVDDRFEEDDVNIVDADLIGGMWEEHSDVTVAQLKEELAKREHVMNKPEGSAARRARQLQGRQRGRRDR